MKIELKSRNESIKFELTSNTTEKLEQLIASLEKPPFYSEMFIDGKQVYTIPPLDIYSEDELEEQDEPDEPDEPDEQNKTDQKNTQSDKITLINQLLSRNYLAHYLNPNITFKNSDEVWDVLTEYICNHGTIYAYMVPNINPDILKHARFVDHPNWVEKFLTYITNNAPKISSTLSVQYSIGEDISTPAAIKQKRIQKHLNELTAYYQLNKNTNKFKTAKLEWHNFDSEAGVNELYKHLEGLDEIGIKTLEIYPKNIPNKENTTRFFKKIAEKYISKKTLKIKISINEGITYFNSENEYYKFNFDMNIPVQKYYNEQLDKHALQQSDQDDFEEKSIPLTPKSSDKILNIFELGGQIQTQVEYQEQEQEQAQTQQQNQESSMEQENEQGFDSIAANTQKFDERELITPKTLKSYNSRILNIGSKFLFSSATKYPTIKISPDPNGVIDFTNANLCPGYKNGINAIHEKAWETILLNSYDFQQGINPDNLPAGFYLAKNEARPNDGYVLCFDHTLTKDNATKLTISSLSSFEERFGNTSTITYDIGNYILFEKSREKKANTKEALGLGYNPKDFNKKENKEAREVIFNSCFSSKEEIKNTYSHFVEEFRDNINLCSGLTKLWVTTGSNGVLLFFSKLQSLKNNNPELYTPFLNTFLQTNSDYTVFLDKPLGLENTEKDEALSFYEAFDILSKENTFSSAETKWWINLNYSDFKKDLGENYTAFRYFLDEIKKLQVTLPEKYPFNHEASPKSIKVGLDRLLTILKGVPPYKRQEQLNTFNLAIKKNQFAENRDFEVVGASESETNDDQYLNLNYENAFYAVRFKKYKFVHPDMQLNNKDIPLDEYSPNNIDDLKNPPATLNLQEYVTYFYRYIGSQRHTGEFSEYQYIAKEINDSNIPDNHKRNLLSIFAIYTTGKNAQKVDWPKASRAFFETFKNNTEGETKENVKNLIAILNSIDFDDLNKNNPEIAKIFTLIDLQALFEFISNINEDAKGFYLNTIKKHKEHGLQALQIWANSENKDTRLPAKLFSSCLEKIETEISGFTTPLLTVLAISQIKPDSDAKELQSNFTDALKNYKSKNESQFEDLIELLAQIDEKKSDIYLEKLSATINTIPDNINTRSALKAYLKNELNCEFSLRPLPGNEQALNDFKQGLCDLLNIIKGDYEEIEDQIPQFLKKSLEDLSETLKAKYDNNTDINKLLAARETVTNAIKNPLIASPANKFDKIKNYIDATGENLAKYTINKNEIKTARLAEIKTNISNENLPENTKQQAKELASTWFDIGWNEIDEKNPATLIDAANTKSKSINESIQKCIEFNDKWPGSGNDVIQMVFEHKSSVSAEILNTLLTSIIDHSDEYPVAPLSIVSKLINHDSFIEKYKNSLPEKINENLQHINNLNTDVYNKELLLKLLLDLYTNDNANVFNLVYTILKDDLSLLKVVSKLNIDDLKEDNLKQIKELINTKDIDKKEYLSIILSEFDNPFLLAEKLNEIKNNKEKLNSLVTILANVTKLNNTNEAIINLFKFDNDKLKTTLNYFDRPPYPNVKQINYILDNFHSDSDAKFKLANISKDPYNKRFADKDYKNENPNKKYLTKQFSDADVNSQIEKINNLIFTKPRSLFDTQKNKLQYWFHYVNQIGNNLPVHIKENAARNTHKTIKPIREFTPGDVQAFTFQLQETVKSKEATEEEKITAKLQFLALMREMMYRTTPTNDRTDGIMPYSTQTLAVLNAMLHGKNVLSQINTGEGKTFITGLMAGMKWLEGNKVDICTSNSALAHEGIDVLSDFYASLGIKATYIDQKSKFQTYQDTDIHYAEVSSMAIFQAKHRIEESDPFSNPRALMLDEADFTILDDTTSYRYAKNFSEHLGANANPNAWIYQLINEFVDININENGEYNPDKISTEKLKLWVLEKKLTHSQRKRINIIKPDQIKSWITASIKAKVLIAKNKDNILKADENAVIKSNYSTQLKNLKQNSDFVIVKENKKIGGQEKTIRAARLLTSDQRISQGSTYSDGVHQLLHDRLNTILPNTDKEPFLIEPETSAVSTVKAKSFIEHYRKSGGIWGVTGTIGSNEECKMLRKKYGFELSQIPSHKENKRKNYKPELKTDKKFNKALLDHVCKGLKKNQPILVFCENSLQVDNRFKIIEEGLKARNNNLDKKIAKLAALVSFLSFFAPLTPILTLAVAVPIFLKIRQLSKQKIKYESINKFSTEIAHDKARQVKSSPKEIETYYVKQAARDNTITVTTTMLGRGTDFKPTNKNGLYDIQTFLASDRETRQMGGRAGRNGQNGDFAQLINKSELITKQKRFESTEKYLHRIRLARQQSRAKVQTTQERFSEINSHFATTFNELIVTQFKSSQKNDILKQWAKFLDSSEKYWNELIKTYKDIDSIADKFAEESCNNWQKFIRKIENNESLPFFTPVALTKDDVLIKPEVEELLYQIPYHDLLRNNSLQEIKPELAYLHFAENECKTDNNIAINFYKENLDDFIRIYGNSQQFKLNTRDEIVNTTNIILGNIAAREKSVQGATAIFHNKKVEHLIQMINDTGDQDLSELISKNNLTSSANKVADTNDINNIQAIIKEAIDDAINSGASNLSNFEKQFEWRLKQTLQHKLGYTTNITRQDKDKVNITLKDKNQNFYEATIEFTGFEKYANKQGFNNLQIPPNEEVSSCITNVNINKSQTLSVIYIFKTPKIHKIKTLKALLKANKFDGKIEDKPLAEIYLEALNEEKTQGQENSGWELEAFEIMNKNPRFLQSISENISADKIINLANRLSTSSNSLWAPYTALKDVNNSKKFIESMSNKERLSDNEIKLLRKSLLNILNSEKSSSDEKKSFIEKESIHNLINQQFNDDNAIQNKINEIENISPSSPSSSGNST